MCSVSPETKMTSSLVKRRNGNLLYAWYLWAPSAGRTLGRYPFHHNGLTLDSLCLLHAKKGGNPQKHATLSSSCLCPKWPAKVPTRGISVGWFLDYLISSPFSGVWSQRSTARSLVRISRWPDCTLSRGASARTSTAG